MLLDVQDLSVVFKTEVARLAALRHVSLKVEAGEVLGVVGESGSGKSVTNLALMGLLPNNAEIQYKSISFAGGNLNLHSQNDLKKLRGSQIAMIFQDPMTALNPVLSVGYQMTEVLKQHLGLSQKEATQRSLELLERVGIQNPQNKLKSYPFELSGGMAQRVMIAIAMSCRPKLLIADEPTTALDVTIQKQILDLLQDLQKETQMAMIFVSHDLALVRKYSHRVQVMYAGEVVETGATEAVISTPHHPYTFGLLKARPSAHSHESKTKLYSIPGVVPSLRTRPTGCQFHPRCSRATDICKQQDPVLTGSQRKFACFHPLGLDNGNSLEAR